MHNIKIMIDVYNKIYVELNILWVKSPKNVKI
jgi:hypothetical protein